MKKSYNDPSMEIEKFCNAQIITASTGFDDNEVEDPFGEPA